MIYFANHNNYLGCNIVRSPTSCSEDADTLQIYTNQTILSTNHTKNVNDIEILLLQAMHWVQNLKFSNFLENPTEDFQAAKGKKTVTMKNHWRWKSKVKPSTTNTFKSLWYTPLLWQYSTPSISCWKYLLDSASLSRPWCTWCKTHDIYELMNIKTHLIHHAWRLTILSNSSPPVINSNIM